MTTIQKIFPYLIILILAWVLLAKGCKEPEIRYEKRDIYRDRIITLNKSKDSTQLQANKKDTARVKIIVKWRTKIADTIYKPCDSLILICNEIITVDSSEIASLKHINTLNDSIISDYKKIVHSDTLDMNCLKKEIKKQKRQKALAITGLILAGTSAILK